MSGKDNVEYDETERGRNASENPLQNQTEYSQEQKPQKSFCFVKRLKHDQDFRLKHLYTAFVYWLFLVFGWKVGQQGPSLLDLQVITKTSLDKVSAIYTSDSIGYLAGSFLSGFLFRKLNTAILLFVAAIGSALSIVVIPWCKMFELMIAVYFIKGIFDAMVDTVSNAELFRIWKTENTLYVQTLHFFFTVGASISPSVTAPFLIPTLQEGLKNASVTAEILDLKMAIHTFGDNLTDAINESISMGCSNSHEFDNNSTYLEKHDISINTTNIQISKLFIAYSITSFLYVLAAISFIFSYLKVEKKFFLHSRNNKGKRHPSKKLPLTQKIILCIIIGCLTATFAVFDTALYGFLTAFCVRQLKWSKTSASHLTSVYWATFCIGRLMAIFFLKRLTSSKLIAINSFSLILVFTGVLISSLYMFNGGVWICVGLAGFFMSSMTPTIFTWTDNELFPVTGFITSLIFCSGALGGIVSPIVLGYLMDNIAVMTFCYTILGATIMFVCLFMVALCLSKRTRKAKSRIESGVEVEVNLTNNPDLNLSSN